MARNDQFNKVQVQVPKSNKFDLSHDYKTSLDMGTLVPFMMTEALPGDVFKLSSSNLVRFLPLATPFMGRVKVYTSYFFVPNRIIYDKWEDFITGGQNPAEAPTLPYIPTATISVGSLGDYLGLPLGSGIGNPDRGLTTSALPFAAYQRCWYDYYRDQNLQDIEWVNLNEGYNGTLFENFHMVLRKRAWGRDYLTSALPFAQKGDPVAIPVQVNITGHAPVELSGDTHHMQIRKADGTVAASVPLVTGNSGFADAFANTSDELVVLDPNGRLYIDGEYLDANDISTTINDLRTAEALQRWLEKNARAGSRYIEVLRAHFGAAPTDERLQRAEYIGSSVGDIVVSEVLQQSQPAAGQPPLATMGGHGISTNRGKMHLYTAQEHGFIVGLISILPETSYSQGVERKWSRIDRLDFAWPEFAHLGEQAVLGKEVWKSTKPVPADALADNLSTFGYMPRYSEYTFNNNLTTGKLRPSESLGNWTLTRSFNQLNTPLLNESFIVADPSKRIMAVDLLGEPSIITHVYNSVKVWRKLPRYGTPMLV